MERRGHAPRRFKGPAAAAPKSHRSRGTSHVRAVPRVFARDRRLRDVETTSKRPDGLGSRLLLATKTAHVARTRVCTCGRESAARDATPFRKGALRKSSVSTTRHTHSPHTRNATHPDAIGAYTFLLPSLLPSFLSLPRSYDDRRLNFRSHRFRSAAKKNTARFLTR